MGDILARMVGADRGGADRTRGGRRRVRAVIAFVACAMLCALGRGDALAAVLRDPSTGFEIDTTIAGTVSCIMLPAAARDPAACEGIDFGEIDSEFEAAIKKSPSDAPVFAVAIREDEAAVVLSVMISHLTLAAREDIDSFVEGVEGALSRADTSRRLPYEIRDVRGLQSVRFGGQLAGGQGSLRGDLFLRKGNVVAVSLAVPPGAEQLADRVQAAVGATVAFPGSAIEEFGKPRAQRVGFFLGKAVGSLAFLVAIVVAIWYSSRRRRRMQPPPPDPRP